jgi:hypothetical protein
MFEVRVVFDKKPWMGAYPKNKSGYHVQNYYEPGTVGYLKLNRHKQKVTVVSCIKAAPQTTREWLPDIV